MRSWRKPWFEEDDEDYARSEGQPRGWRRLMMMRSNVDDDSTFDAGL